ncbi:peptidyl-prolyl cis-trans isomerase D [Desulfatibacillum alkenivorans DSM 16219]|uniref:Periplasmic chaperone PpiD n=1 Tax=Desulfatibacillum alkenivorans DSM 16219 TaxID=1121393 RepID=A0A1M7AXQ2_9BACT|nr:SurA N-terminal domain-containing protein [Desulfatibacillum alkenivorans]SHL47427.1 peptidyl-prolyl cis-trans isomerase D [Desulfatibacillum alkenivorans DSM 16219]
MLSMMREHATSWIIKILLGIIVLVFVFSFGYSSFQNRGDRLAVVNGETISRNTFERMYKNVYDYNREKFGDSFDYDLLRQNVFDDLVDNVLLLQHARDLGMQVTEDELVQDIAQTQVFQTSSGQFDPERYQYILARSGVTSKDYEAEKARNMLSTKIRSYLMAMAQVSDEEAMQWYNWDGKEVSMKYVLFEPSTFTDVEATEDQIQAYYDAHSEDYETLPMAKVSYLYFNPKDFLEKVSIPQEEIELFYDDNLDSYYEDQQVHARHILISLAKDAPEEKVAEALKKAQEIEAKAKAGEDFAELAKEFSDGPTAKTGGDLGFFPRGRMVKPFEDAAFALNAGEISDPVRTDFGFHIIKVEEIKEARTKELSEVEESIRSKLAADVALDEAYNAAEAAFDNLLSDMDMAKAAADAGVELKTSDYFTEEGPAGVANPQEMADEVFGMYKDSFSDVLQFDDGFYIIWMLDKKPAIIPELAEVKAKVAADVKKEIMAQAAVDKAAEFLEEVKGGKSMEDAAAAYNVTVKNTGFFKRGGYIPDLGDEPAVATAAFMADAANPYPDAPVEGVKGVFVTCVLEEKYPEAEGFADQKESIKQRLLWGKRSRVLEDALDVLRERGEVKQLIPVI